MFTKNNIEKSRQDGEYKKKKTRKHDQKKRLTL